MKQSLLLLSCLALSACSTYQVPDSPTFTISGPWAIMPMENHSNTPLASQKAEQLLATELYVKGVATIQYPATINQDLRSILDFSSKQQQAQQWLATQPIEYVISGSIEEWHYKSGLDAEPAVGVTIEVKSAQTGEVYWRASGSRSGWGRESVTGTGQIVIEQLLDGLNIEKSRSTD